jgi:hypothetical protein
MLKKSVGRRMTLFGLSRLFGFWLNEPNPDEPNKQNKPV